VEMVDISLDISLITARIHELASS